MRYTVELLVKHIRDTFAHDDVVICQGPPACAPATIYSLEQYRAGKKCLEGAAYLCGAHNFPEEKNIAECCVILCIGMPQTIPLPKQGGVFFLFSEHIPLEVIYSEARNCDEKYRRWGEVLRETQDNRDPMQHMLDVSYPIFGNPIFLVDSSFQLIAFAGGGISMDSIVEKMTIQGQELYFISENRLQINSRAVPPVATYHKDVFLYTNSEGAGQSIVAPIFSNQDQIGFLSIGNLQREFQPSDFELMNYFRKSITRVIEEYNLYNKKESERIRDILKELIIFEIVDKKGIQSKLKNYGFSETDTYALFCIDTAAKQNMIPMSYLGYQLENRFSGSILMEYDSEYLALINISRSAAGFDAVLEQIGRMFAQNGLKAGVSDCFTDIFTLRAQHTQAQFALRNRRDASADGQSIFHFSDCSLAFMWYCIRKELPPEFICAKGVLRLAKHDEKTRVSYCDTLRVYLESGMNAAQSASRLFIRRPTFLARMERILRILDMDIADPQTRLHVEISLNLLQKKEP